MGEKKQIYREKEWPRKTINGLRKAYISFSQNFNMVQTNTEEYEEKKLHTNCNVYI